MIDHLSYSSISRYLKCGKQWKYRYIDKLQEESSEALLFGSAWHKMIRRYLQLNTMFMTIEGGESQSTIKRLGDKEAKNELLSSWSWAFNEVLEEIDASGDWFIDMDILGQKMLTSPDITKTIQGLSAGINLESLEMETELHIPGVSVPIVGFIDMIQNDGIPIDIKTSAKKWPVKIDEKTGKEVCEKADKSLQPTFYLAALEQLGMITLPAKFHFIVFTKTKNPEVQILETTRTHEDVFALYGLIGEVWQAIQKEVFAPTDPGNWWCSHKYCGFWDVCEYGGKNG